MSAKFWVHCNKCYVRSNKKTKFSIAKCSHILCFDCAQLAAKNKACSVCKIPTSLIVLDSQMPSNICNYFQSIDSLYKMAKKTMSFQAEHRMRLDKLLAAKYAALRKEYFGLLEKFKKFKSEGDRLQQEISYRSRNNLTFQSEDSRYKDVTMGGQFTDFSMSSNNTMQRPHRMFNMHQASFGSLRSGNDRSRFDFN